MHFPNAKVFELQKRLGLSTAELAAELDVSPSTIRSWRRSKNPPTISPDIVLRFRETARNQGLLLDMEWFYTSSAPASSLALESRATYNGLTPEDFAALQVVRTAAQSLPKVLTAEVLSKYPDVASFAAPVLQDLQEASTFTDRSLPLTIPIPCEHVPLNPLTPH